ncbi:MAG: hypothetical protein ACK5JM_05505 [Rhodoblastus sp.]
MKMYERLLWLADDLATRGKNSLTLKRRAVSTAYYAVFHALARSCADALLSSKGAVDRNSKNYERVYRALDHGPLRNAFGASPLKDDPAFKAIGNLVVRLQIERHNADYLPSRRLYRQSECLLLISSARQAIKLLRALDEDRRLTLATSLLFKNRPS